MKTGLHMFASDGHINSGDYLIGPSTRWYFQQKITQSPIKWTVKNIRDNFSHNDVSYANVHDYIVIGAGGLILPDTNPNNISCWQWPVSADVLRKIQVPLYVISLGYNLFPKQKITMPVRNSFREDLNRYNIFKHNMETLIDVSEHFSLRHKGDCQKLKEIVDSKYHSKINFEFCPTIPYSKYFRDKHNLKSEKRDIYAFEIKDDRPSNRYYNTTRDIFYNDLKKFINILLEAGKRVRLVSHDGSSSFKTYLDSNNINIPVINNSFSTEEKIISNYLKIDKLFCMAGHSQMIGHSLGCDIISLISHDKQKFFLQDVDEYTNKHVDVNHDKVYKKLTEIYERF